MRYYDKTSFKGLNSRSFSGQTDNVMGRGFKPSIHSFPLDLHTSAITRLFFSFLIHFSSHVQRGEQRPVNDDDTAYLLQCLVLRFIYVWVLAPLFSNSCSSDVTRSWNVGRFEGSKFQHEVIIWYLQRNQSFIKFDQKAVLRHIQTQWIYK